jgi:ubiquinone/menaquinone biosynthesis C-methylase UbiE
MRSRRTTAVLPGGLLASSMIREPIQESKMLRLRDYCYKIYWNLESKIVPGLRNSQYVYADTLAQRVPQRGVWLDLGCGHQILPAWMRSAQSLEQKLTLRPALVVGLDPVFSSLRHHQSIRSLVVGQVENSPFRDASFDLITANMVMEHISDPTSALLEIHRILNKHGVLILHTTNVNNYKFALSRLVPQRLKNKLIYLLEGRRGEDVFPTVYRINTARAIRQIAQRCGFDILELSSVNSTAATAVLFPLAFLELLVIRLLEFESAAPYRSNFILVLQKN